MIGESENQFSIARTALGSRSALKQILVSTLCLCTALCSFPLRAQWKQVDIGAVGGPGSATITANSITVRASTADIGNTADSFHFVYQEMVGDGELEVRLVQFLTANEWAKAGVMLRESLDPGSPFIMLYISGTTYNPQPGAFAYHTYIGSQYRKTQGAASAFGNGNSLYGMTPPWTPRKFKISRQGGIVDTYFELAPWDRYCIGCPGGIIQMRLSKPRLYIGLAVSSNNKSVTETAIFDNIRLEITRPVDVTALEVHGPAVVPEESANTYVCTAHYSDGGKTNVSASAQWSIAAPQPGVPGFSFQGANLLTGDLPAGSTNLTLEASYGGLKTNLLVSVTNVPVAIELVAAELNLDYAANTLALTIAGKVTKNGKPRPNVAVGVDDPIRLLSIPEAYVSTSDGLFVYSTEGLYRPGLHLFNFFAEGNSKVLLPVSLTNGVPELLALPDVKIELGPVSPLDISESTLIASHFISGSAAAEPLDSRFAAGVTNFAHKTMRVVSHTLLDTLESRAGDPIGWVAVASTLACLAPELTVTKAACYLGVTYTVRKVKMDLFRNGIKNVIAETAYPETTKARWHAMVDGAFLAWSAIRLQKAASVLDIDSFSWNSAKYLAQTAEFGRTEKGRERLSLLLQEGDDVVAISLATLDSDNDGIPDDIEAQAPPGGLQPGDDSDGDGMTNLDEVLAGTDPLQSSSCLKVSATVTSAQQVTKPALRWPSAYGRHYNILRADNVTGPFGRITSDLPATPPENSFVDENAPPSAASYYRVEVIP